MNPFKKKHLHIERRLGPKRETVVMPVRTASGKTVAVIKKETIKTGYKTSVSYKLYDCNGTLLAADQRLSFIEQVLLPQYRKKLLRAALVKGLLGSKDLEPEDHDLTAKHNHQTDIER